MLNYTNVNPENTSQHAAVAANTQAWPAHFVLHKSEARGHANHGWLNSYHSFSFGRYYDPNHMQFSVLRVINDDVIAPSRGFGMHPHNDMEIITYMLQGELRHEDSLGNGSVIKAGDVQRMTAGTGIVHSEVNASQMEPSHLLQIWILPDTLNLTPSYEEKNFTRADKLNRWCLVAGKNGGVKNALTVNQSLDLYATTLDETAPLDFTLNGNRSAYLHVATGSILLNGELLSAGDAVMIAALNETQLLSVQSQGGAEVLLFDLPPNE